MSLMCNVFASLEPDHSVINSSKLFLILITHCSRNGFKPCGTSVLIYSSLNKEQQNSLQSILFFAKGFKDEMINFKCIS